MLVVALLGLLLSKRTCLELWAVLFQEPEEPFFRALSLPHHPR